MALNITEDQTEQVTQIHKYTATEDGPVPFVLEAFEVEGRIKIDFEGVEGRVLLDLPVSHIQYPSQLLAYITADQANNEPIE